MQPSEFWATDTWSVMDAYEGYAISKGGKSTKEWTQDELGEIDRMIERDNQRMKKLKEDA